MRRGRPAPATTLAFAILLAGCSASRIESGVFHSPKGYSLTIPDGGWRLAPRGEADLELTRDAPPGGMLADATCAGRERDRTLSVLARHLTFGLTERVMVESDSRSVDGRPAEHRVVRGLADGMPVTVEALVVQGERCIHDFLYVAPAGDFEGGRKDFRAFVQSLVRSAR